MTVRVTFAAALGLVMALASGPVTGADADPWKSRPAPAEPGWVDRMAETAETAAVEMEVRTREAIALGGAFLNRNRHTVSGVVIGCAMGSAAGAVAAGLAGAATSGGALIGTVRTTREVRLLCWCSA